MKNTLYYIILCVISTLIFIYTLWKKKDNKLISLYFFIAGYTYFLEYFVLVIFNGYSYNPDIMKNYYFDNIIGAIASDAFVIPMVSTFAAGLNLNFYKRFLIAVIITIIEIVFVRVDAFEMYWWKDLYTLLGAVITFYFAQKWLSILQGKINSVVQYITLFLSNLYIQCSLSFLLSGILNLFFYNVTWFSNPNRGHVAFATLYIMFITSIFAAVVTFRQKWFWRILVVLFLSITDIILIKMNILTISHNWSLIGFIFFRAVILIFISLFNKYLLTENES